MQDEATEDELEAPTRESRSAAIDAIARAIVEEAKARRQRRILVALVTVLFAASVAVIMGQLLRP